VSDKHKFDLLQGWSQEDARKQPPM